MNEFERMLRYSIFPFVDVSAHEERNSGKAKLDVCFVATVTGPVNIIFKLWNFISHANVLRCDLCATEWNSAFYYHHMHSAQIVNGMYRK